MEWLNVTATQGLWGLFVSAFLSATVLPGSSEVLLFGFLQQHADEFWPAIGVAALGNTLGGMTTYACGRYLPKWQALETLPHQAAVRRFGPAALLLAWLPLLGDALCLVAGWLKLPWLACGFYMGIGKTLRYALVAQGALF